jgi:class 3 adenylate cyclase
MTENHSANNRKIKTIAGRILEDQCILVCGSELSALAEESYANTKVAELFRHRHPESFPEIDGNNNYYSDKSLAEIIQIYANTPLSDEVKEQNTVDSISRNFLREHIELVQTPSTAHMILANLGCKYIYTTNYDKLIEKAYIKAGFPQEAINIVSAEFGDNRSLQFDFPHIYKLCGTAGERNIRLAERQFTNGKIYFSDEMRLRLLRRTIVFLGYNSFDDIMLTPFVKIIGSCHPKAYYCVTQSSQTQPKCLQALGEPMCSLQMDIGEFFAQLYMELLSQTSDLFGYLSTKRKVIENSAIAFFKNRIDSLDQSKLRDIEVKLNEHRNRMENGSSLGDAWYWDFSFHQSLYKALPVQTFEKDFSKIYLKLRVFYSTYQSNSTFTEHKEIYRNLSNGNVLATARCLNRHLRNVSETAAFWLRYLNIVNRDILQIALHDYRSPLYTENHIKLDEMVLKEHDKILLLGESNSGKTTYSVRQVVLSITTGSAIPVYIDLGSLKFGDSEIAILAKNDDFANFLYEYFKILNLSSKMLTRIVEEKILNSGFLLIIDGIEKLQSSLAERFLQCIRSFLSDVNGLKVIVTSHSDLKFVDKISQESLSQIIGFAYDEIFVLPKISAVNLQELVGQNITLAIVFVDIVGSTELTYLFGENRMRGLMKLHFSQVDRLIHEMKGNRIRVEGDGHLVAFGSAGSALDYAMKLQRNTGDPNLRIRAGIHLGEVIVDDQNRIDGKTVAYTKRVIEAIQGADEIWLSTNAKEQIMHMNRPRHNDLKWEAIESRSLKGFPGKHTLWKVYNNQRIVSTLP